MLIVKNGPTKPAHFRKELCDNTLNTSKLLQVIHTVYDGIAEQSKRMN